MQGLPRKKRKAYENVQKYLLNVRKLAKPEYLSYAAPGSNSLQSYLDQLEKSLSNIEFLDDRAILNIKRRAAMLEQIFTLRDISDRLKSMPGRSDKDSHVTDKIDGQIYEIIEMLKKVSLEI
jgi:hypothetical protein